MKDESIKRNQLSCSSFILHPSSFENGKVIGMSSLLRFSGNRTTGWPKLFALAVLMAGSAALSAADTPPSPQPLSPAAGERGRGEGQEPDTAKFIRFDVSVEPLDPFDPSNQANRNWWESLKVRPGEVFRLTITATPEPGYHTYPVTQRSSDPEMTDAHLTKIEFQDLPGLKPLWPISESEPAFAVEEGVGVFLEHLKPFTLAQDILVLPEATPGPKSLPFSIKLQVCKKTCIQGTHHFSPKIEVSAAPALALTPELKQRLEAKPPPIKVRTVPVELVPSPHPLSPAAGERGSGEGPEITGNPGRFAPPACSASF